MMFIIVRPIAIKYTISYGVPNKIKIRLLFDVKGRHQDIIPPRAPPIRGPKFFIIWGRKHVI